jgi:hypothetical protein
MTCPDPFTRIERLLWHILESHPGFTDRVPVGNRIKRCESSQIADRAKQSPQVADLPEVQIRPAGGQGEQARTSSGEGFEQQYEIQISTSFITSQGNNAATELQKGIGPLKWEVIKAFAHRADVYPTHGFVKRITVVPIAEFDFEDNPASRGPGWTAVLTVSVFAHWPNMEIQRWRA